MNKNKPNKKLKLRVETLRHLDARALDKAVGGTDAVDAGSPEPAAVRFYRVKSP